MEVFRPPYFQKWGYTQASDAITLASGAVFPTAHLIGTYNNTLMPLAESSQKPLTSLNLEVTTGTESVAPWWGFDDPGTLRLVTYKIGLGKDGTQLSGELTPWMARDDGSYGNLQGFLKGSTARFKIHNPGLLTREDLKQWTIAIESGSGGLINWDKDNWRLGGVKIIADGTTV